MIEALHSNGNRLADRLARKDHMMFFFADIFEKHLSEESFLPEMSPFSDEVVSVNSKT